MAMMKQTGGRKPAAKKAAPKAKAAFVGYGTNVAAGKKITQKALKTVRSGVEKAGKLKSTPAYKAGYKAGLAGNSRVSADSPRQVRSSPRGKGMSDGGTAYDMGKYYTKKPSGPKSKRGN